MSDLLAKLNAKGHDAHLDGLRIVVRLAPGADADKARAWCLSHEQALRRELVTEAQAVAGIRMQWPAARVRAMLDPWGRWRLWRGTPQNP